jgi:hypothetical protein
MSMTRTRWLTLLPLVSLATGCNFNAAAPTPTPLAPPPTLLPATSAPATAAPPTAAPSDTPFPASPTPASSPTPTEVTLSPISGDVPCRFGPATEFSVDGKLTAGNTTPALARNASSTWIRIEHETHPRWNCWLKAADVTVSGNLADVPVEAPPAAIVTNVEVDMTPSEASVPGCVFPYTFSVRFWITVNGPTEVKYQRSKSNGDKAPVETQAFAASGRYEFADSYRVGATGSYWFQVDVMSPNAMSGRGTAKAVCGP